MAARIVASLLALSFAAVACGGTTVSPGGEPTGVATLDPDATPDIGRLKVSTVGWKTDFSRASVDLGEFLGGGPPKDGIASIDDPKFESLLAARDWLDDRSPVIALVVGDEARAYPLAILMWHEIANDTIAGVPVVVTFCPLCNTALVFERDLDGTVHDFGTTGNLRYSDLVMYDRQTESWWQQATGEAIVGQLTGSKLVFLPAQIVSLADFASAYPDGVVMSRDSGFTRDYGRNPYVGYDTVDTNPFLFDGVLDGRLPPKERVVTVGQGADAVGFPYSELRKVGVATGMLDGSPYVVFWVPGTASALDKPNVDAGADIGSTGVFRPTVDGRELTFTRDVRSGAVDPIRDVETGSTWSVTGLASAGELAGRQLEPVVHGDHFWFAWAAFAPQTTIWTADSVP